MSSLTVVGCRGRALLRLTPARSLDVAAVLVPVVVMVAALQGAAPDAPLWPALLIGVPALWATVDPDGPGGLVTLLATGAWWLQAVPGPTTAWALLAAVAALVFHVALSVVAAGPWGLVVDRVVLRRLLRDGTAVVTATAGIAWLTELAHGGPAAPALLVALTLGLVGVLPWLAVRR